MIVTALAKRYARALADVASELGTRDAVADDLQSLVGALRRSPELATALGNPGIPQTARVGLVESLWRQSGAALNPQFRNLVVILIRNNRMGLLEQIHSAYQTDIDARTGVVAGEVTTRFEIHEGQRNQLAAKLQSVTGMRVRLSFHRDESILGGVILRIGSTVYDGSVRRQLEAVRARLSGQA